MLGGYINTTTDVLVLIFVWTPAVTNVSSFISVNATKRIFFLLRCYASNVNANNCMDCCLHRDFPSCSTNILTTKYVSSPYCCRNRSKLQCFQHLHFTVPINSEYFTQGKSLYQTLLIACIDPVGFHIFLCLSDRIFVPLMSQTHQIKNYYKTIHEYSNAW